MTRAVTYARISVDDKRTESVETQQKQCLAHAERNGWDVVREFKDKGKSAYDTDVVREDFQRMLAFLETEQVDVVIARHHDRLTRNRPDFDRLLDICGPRRIKISTYAGGELDLSTPQGGFHGLIDTAVSWYSSAISGQRLDESIDTRKKEGKRTGGGRYRWFGYVSVYRDPEETNPSLRRKLREDLEPGEAELIGRTVRDLLDPDQPPRSLRQIASEWNGLGVTRPASQKGWTGSDIRRLLASPHIAAIVRWKGKEYDAAWPAIITKEQHVALVKHLDNPSRRRLAEPPSGERKHLLAGLVFCGSCGGRMVCAVPQPINVERKGQTKDPGSREGKGRVRTYMCRPQHRKDDPSYTACLSRMRIDAEALEEYVVGAVTALWASPKASKAALAVDDQAKQLVAKTAELRGLQEDLDDLLDNRRQRIKEYGEEAYSAVVKRKKTEHDKKQREYDRLNTADSKVRLPDPSIGWDNLTYDEKRELIKLLIPGGITVRPHPRVWDADEHKWKYPIAMRPYADPVRETHRKAEVMEKRVEFAD